MEVFEVHITGDESILETAKKLALKTITINLLKPDYSYLRTEYMTSHVFRFPTYKECKEKVDDVVLRLRKDGTQIERVKIESPYYAHYADQSCYIESHFEAKNNLYPISQNIKKTDFLATDREYNRKDYNAFMEKYEGEVIEICLFDSNIGEDLDWFKLYKGIM